MKEAISMLTVKRGSNIKFADCYELARVTVTMDNYYYRNLHYNSFDYRIFKKKIEFDSNWKLFNSLVFR